MKLDKDVAENINNGYEALQKSSDDRTMRLSRQLFYYTLLKDGLGFSNNSFLSYLNPDLKAFKDVSDHLDNFQELLADQQTFINEQNKNIERINNSGIKAEDKIVKIKEIVDKVYANYTALFDKFFESNNPGKTDWINLIVRKIFSNAVNQKYVRQYFGANIQAQDSKDLVNDLIAAGVFSNLTKKAFGKKFDFTKDAPPSFAVDFTSLLGKRDFNMMLDNVFGNIFSPRYDMKMELTGMSFPMLIKNSEGRLFKLMAIDNKSVSEDIAYQSITGVYKGTNGAKAEYREIEIEGTNNILNFGFTQSDGIALYNRSQEKFNQDEDADLLAFGITQSEISDNKSKRTIQSQLGNIPNEALDNLSAEDQAIIDAAKAKRDAKKQGKPIQAQNVQQQKVSTIQLLPENEEKIKDGTKSITNRTLKQKIDDGIYTMSDGTQVEVKLFGLYNVEYIGDAVIVTSNSGGPTFSGDEYAKAEGFKDWIDFQENNNFSKNFVDGNQARYVYAIKVVQQPSSTSGKVEDVVTDEMQQMINEAKAKRDGKKQNQAFTGTDTLIPNNTSVRSIVYTPKGKEKQTYTIEGTRILNKNGDEVFKEDSIDRNRIFANLAVKEGRAKVVEYEGIKYVVNKKDQIISGATGRIMQWDARNKNRIAVLALANNPPLSTASDNVPMADPNAITDADIASIYRDKVDYLKAQNLPVESLESFSTRAKKVESNLKKISASKEDILETIKCL
jgi:hypothetical protein